MTLLSWVMLPDRELAPPKGPMETLFCYFSAEKLIIILNSIYFLSLSPSHIPAFIHAIETFCQKANAVLFILFMGALYKFSILQDSEIEMFIGNMQRNKTIFITVSKQFYIF